MALSKQQQAKLNLLEGKRRNLTAEQGIELLRLRELAKGRALELPKRFRPLKIRRPL